MRDHDHAPAIIPADRARQEIGTKDLQEIVSKVAARKRVAINAKAPKFGAYCPTKTLISVGADVSKDKPALAASYEAVTGGAARAATTWLRPRYVRR